MATVWVILMVAACHVAHAQTYSILHSFQCSPDGAAPLGNLIADGAGNIYGTTQGGGTAVRWGTVYKMAPDGTVTVLYSFTDGADGAEPKGGVVMDGVGNRRLLLR